METLSTMTADQIWRLILLAVTALLFIAASIYTIGKAIDTVRGWRKPHADIAARVEAHEKRLCKGDGLICDLQEGQRILCVGMSALLESSVYGNNTDGVKKARKELTDYLTDRIASK